MVVVRPPEKIPRPPSAQSSAFTALAGPGGGRAFGLTAFSSCQWPTPRPSAALASASSVGHWPGRSARALPPLPPPPPHPALPPAAGRRAAAAPPPPCAADAAAGAPRAQVRARRPSHPPPSPAASPAPAGSGSGSAMEMCARASSAASCAAERERRSRCRNSRVAGRASWRHARSDVVREDFKREPRGEDTPDRCTASHRPRQARGRQRFGYGKYCRWRKPR